MCRRSCGILCCRKLARQQRRNTDCRPLRTACVGAVALHDVFLTRHNAFVTLAALDRETS
jgi:hypothetical protein